VAILGTVIWCLILVVPAWLRFLRGDLKYPRGPVAAGARRNSTLQNP
jgi:hypothetical protein